MGVADPCLTLRFAIRMTTYATRPQHERHATRPAPRCTRLSHRPFRPGRRFAANAAGSSTQGSRRAGPSGLRNGEPFVQGGFWRRGRGHVAADSQCSGLWRVPQQTPHWGSRPKSTASNGPWRNVNLASFAAKRRPGWNPPQTAPLGTRHKRL